MSEEKAETLKERLAKYYAEVSEEEIKDSTERWRKNWGDPNKVRWEREKAEILQESFGVSHDASYLMVFLISCNTWLAHLGVCFDRLVEHTQKHEKLMEKLEDEMNEGDEWKPDED